MSFPNITTQEQEGGFRQRKGGGVTTGRLKLKSKSHGMLRNWAASLHSASEVISVPGTQLRSVHALFTNQNLPEEKCVGCSRF